MHLGGERSCTFVCACAWVDDIGEVGKHVLSLHHNLVGQRRDSRTVHWEMEHDSNVCVCVCLSDDVGEVGMHVPSLHHDLGRQGVSTFRSRTVMCMCVSVCMRVCVC